MPTTDSSYPNELSREGAPRLRELALAAIAMAIVPEAEHPPAEKKEALLLQQLSRWMRSQTLAPADQLAQCLKAPPPPDQALVHLGSELNLSPTELLSIALAAAVEDDPLTGRVLAYAQAPLGGSRPALALVTHAFPVLIEKQDALLARLLAGRAMECGLLDLMEETAPLPERPLSVPIPICLALQGHDGHWPGVGVDLPKRSHLPLPPSVLSEGRRQADALHSDSNLQRTLAIRTGSVSEGRMMAAVMAQALNKRPAYIDPEQTALKGIGPWLALRHLLPVFVFELSPGERRLLADIPGYSGPLLAVTGPDGSIEDTSGAAVNWRLPIPRQAERCALWRSALGDQPLAGVLGKEFRHGSGRIAHLGRFAHYHAALAGREVPASQDILEAAWNGEAGGLEALAEPLNTRIPDEALVCGTTLKTDLESLLQRCRLRDELVSDLGISASTRYRPGLRALFTGASGTGKTLAAGWLATRLNLPLFRVDLASITSKYIGETEKNLSQLLARAEQAEVVLLFDEADSLFGKRTDISDSNDRFANAQTNYLLQRIENYDGIVLLTSNSQTRFDPAFTRRLDFTIDFPLPGPEERRALWQSHLGSNTTLRPAELNQLAVLIDVSGGHIRNAVLAAAVLARAEDRHIHLPDLIQGVTSEYRKLGRQLPLEFLTEQTPKR